MIVGTNDIGLQNVNEALENYAQILKALPNSCKTIVSSVLPLDETARPELIGRNMKIEEFNRRLKKIASEYANVVFLDNTKYFDTDGNNALDHQYHGGDGIHLNAKGSALLVSNIKQTLAETGIVN